MTVNATPKTFAPITALGSNGRFNTWQKDGLLSTILISNDATGIDFGGAPFVEMFDSFQDGNTGDLVALQARQGTWLADGNSTTYLNRSTIVEVAGRRGATHNDPAPNQGNTKMGLSYFFQNPDVGFLRFTKLLVPDGKNPPESLIPETWTELSAWKQDWVCGYEWNGSPATNDVVSNTMVGSGNFSMVGNNVKGIQLANFKGKWVWGDNWNNFLSMYSPDPLDPQGVNGFISSTVFNANGRFDDQEVKRLWQPTVAGNGLITPYMFDRNAPFAYTGNGDSINSQLVMAQHYLATGENREKYILLMNSMGVVSRPNLNADVVAADLDENGDPMWEGNLITYTPTQEEMDNNTHIFAMNRHSIMARGRL